MNKAQEYLEIGENTKGTLWSRCYYKYVLRACRKAAKEGYKSMWFSGLFFNPYIIKKLKKDECFKIKRKEGRVRVSWKKAKEKEKKTDDKPLVIIHTDTTC